MNRWIHAARLRTLPLASASILTGGILAASESGFRLPVFILALATTFLLQIMANLANDYGDSVHGADNKSRIGPERTVQSGRISRTAMIRAIILTGIITAMTGVALILVSTWGRWILTTIFASIGLLSIWAAIRYTAGSKPYGYLGHGDISVFIFFGLVGVYGSYYLNTLEHNPMILLPAAGIGLLSTGVLNLNNMRDHRQDVKSGKMTLAVKFGFKPARIYHACLLLIALVAVEVFSTVNGIALFQRLYLLTVIPIIHHLISVSRVKNPVDLDPHLKRLSLMTLLYAAAFSINILWMKL